MKISKFKKILLRHYNIATIIAALLCLIFIVAGSLVSLNRYWQYESFFYDFGIFDQAIWKVAHLTPPIIDHLVVGDKWIFADHFNPSIFLLSPLYWFTDKREILLIAQAAIVGLSGFVLYLTSVEVLKNRLYSLAILTCYLLFIGLQNAVITDFHEVTLATLPFMAAYLALIKKRFKWYLVMLVLMLGFKESNFLVGIGMGISIYFINKSYIKLALLTCGLSLLWGYLAINHIIPYFSGGFYQYSVELSRNPVVIFNTFFDNDVKKHALFFSFLNFGFLPLLSYPFYFLMFQDFLTRFYSPFAYTRWGLGLHYSALLSAIMGIASVYSFKFLARKIKKKIILDVLAILLIINAIILYRFILHAPFGLAYNPTFYAHSNDFQFLDDLVKKIPPDATVMAQNNLAVRFTHQKVSTLQSNLKKYKPDFYTQKMPDYIVFDTREGQNPNNFFLVEDINDLLNELKNDPNYEVFYKTHEQFIFKRKF